MQLAPLVVKMTIFINKVKHNQKLSHGAKTYREPSSDVGRGVLLAGMWFSVPARQHTTASW